ncbi:MAG: hypothetical protein DHS20C05_12260 [Hyphococcus sp.]|nr:MAG: hypothetical protein DHS20C05_12260 [Marinicaulis sp.]
MRRRTVVAGLCSLAPFGAAAQKLVKPIAISGRGYTVGDETFILSDIIAPSLYGWADKPEPYAEQATRILQSFLYGGAPIVTDESPNTRWGERVVIAHRVGGKKTLQEELVASGATRVCPVSNDNEFIERLLTTEETARRAMRGLWEFPAYRPHKALEAEKAIGAFNLVEGVVKKAVSTRKRFYLNFGDDYKTDFTVTASASFYKRWAKAGYDLAQYEGRKIRVRGFVDMINGPMIELNHPRQIETLKDTI